MRPAAAFCDRLPPEFEPVDFLMPARNAGGTWVDRDAVDDEGLVSSRKPADLPAFCRQFVDVVSRHLTRVA